MSAGEQREQSSQAQAETSESLLEAAISATKQTERSRAEELIRTFAEEAMKGTPTRAKDLTRKIQAMIDGLDQAVSKQLAAVMQELKAAREEKGLSLADVYQRTGIDRSALSKLEKVTNENPTIDTLLRYAEVVGKRIEIQVLER